jgi:hypothetical protein
MSVVIAVLGTSALLVFALLDRRGAGILFRKKDDYAYQSLAVE